MKFIISLLLMLILIGCNQQTETANTETHSTEEVAVSQVEATEKSDDIVDLASLNSVQVGIESIERDGDKVAIHVYAINPQPMAGVQLQLQPGDVFEIDSVTGGRCEAMDFMMRENPLLIVETNNGIPLSLSLIQLATHQQTHIKLEIPILIGIVMGSGILQNHSQTPMEVAIIL